MSRAVYTAKWNKYQHLQRIESEKRRKETEDMFKQPWTAERYWEFIQWKIGELKYKFVIDGNNSELLFALCCYFTDDERFIEYGNKLGYEWNLQKGLLLMAAPGVGKSEMIKLFSQNPKQSFDFVPCEHIGSKYKAEGDHILAHFATYRSDVPSPKNFFQQRLGFVFDDLGRENAVSNYGPSILPMQNILQVAYDRKDLPWYTRHVTTMYDWDYLQEKYGYHIRSRMREMYNQIILSGEDRRK